MENTPLKFFYIFTGSLYTDIIGVDENEIVVRAASIAKWMLGMKLGALKTSYRCIKTGRTLDEDYLSTSTPAPNSPKSPSSSNAKD